MLKALRKKKISKYEKQNNVTYKIDEFLNLGN